MPALRTCAPLLLLGLAACASGPEPRARQLEGKARLGPVQRPDAKARLKPKQIRTQPKTPVRPAWKKKPVRALDADLGAKAEVDDLLRPTREEERRRMLAARKRRVIRRAASQAAKKEAARKLGLWLKGEISRRAQLLGQARPRWLKRGKARRAAYLKEARRLARRKLPGGIVYSPPAIVVEKARALATTARRYADASEQLRKETSQKALLARRFAKSTLATGLKLPEAHDEAEKAERRLTEITLISAYYRLEAKWARLAVKQAEAAWDRSLNRRWAEKKSGS